MSQPVRVAIVGGGCAAMAAAFELTKPGLKSRYQVTVYQMGWRLGGKGASGRGVHGRIEEHGLHLWMGYYENAFRWMRECYGELARDPAKVPIATWSDAFLPANFNAVADWSPSGRWLPWLVDFPPSPGLPGDPGAARWGVQDYLARAASLVRALLQTLRAEGDEGKGRQEDLFPELKIEPLTAEALAGAAGRVARFGALAGLGASIEAARALETALRAAPAMPQSLVAGFFEAVDALLRRQLAALTRTDDGVRRLWEVIDLLLAVIRGSIRFRLAFDPRGFDAIDSYDSREWLRLNGASEDSINSAFVRALYDLAFAYEGGDSTRPCIAAGSALRGAFRAFFTYRGAFFWKMNGGMGDVVFAPVYEVLKRRGVRFAFFHKLTKLRLAPATADSPHVEALDFDVQARVTDGAGYRPLVDVGGLPSWPSTPDYAQLKEGDRIRTEGWDLESQWDTRRASSRTLEVGRDFDVVVLAVGLGVVPYVCSDLVARDSRWRDMLAHVKSVPTQAFQLWMQCPMADLGWHDRPVNVSGFVEPFDTWADMTHVAPRESWSRPPGAIAYFCNVLRESAATPSPTDWLAPERGRGRWPARATAAGEFVAEEERRVRKNAIDFLNHEVHHLWPAAHSKGPEFRWAVLHAESRRRGSLDGEAAFDTQFWTANVRPSDRYSQALPGSTRFRISPLDRTYDNMTIAGDWTSCGLNMGCVEAAVISGMLASHAIAESPRLSDIVGYDHP
jgi:uncharacterized protein with NAD-binding domain and iron-sulfur cluster